LIWPVESLRNTHAAFMSCGAGRRDNAQYHRYWRYRSLDKARLGSRL
jgi:hypothetical protein